MSILAIVVVLFGGISPVTAEDSAEPSSSDDLQQEEAREAVRQKLVRPLEEILVEVRKTFKGDIIEVEFEKHNGQYVYEIELIRPDGHLVEVKIDARTLAVVEIEDD
ncbi:PepSY domain-containing protein [Rhizobium sp. KVB221]|uniref:PepSY domain-containing protein n=1 Tax=Rhizobium setariae TaxID=2801340 RepID=A0A936YMH2_9HYPH|nr:PepSY domain-containing protein [Rhizobium setariae]MBL0371447.1 PepSY domain-containing protein [Rhizobium setariae]